MNEKNLERVEAQRLENTERGVAELAATAPPLAQFAQSVCCTVPCLVGARKAEAASIHTTLTTKLKVSL